MYVPDIQRYDRSPPLPLSPDAFDQMQHGIRSPLCAILGAAEFFSASASTSRQQDMADALMENSETLKNRVDALGALFRKE